MMKCWRSCVRRSRHSEVRDSASLTPIDALSFAIGVYPLGIRIIPTRHWLVEAPHSKFGYGYLTPFCSAHLVLNYQQKFG
jgi:hypothetical protein